MTSTRERQRAAARARLERQMSERAEAARKRRRLQATIGAGVAVLVVAAGGVWLIAKYAGGEDKKPAAAANGAACTWTEVPKDQRTPQVIESGLPPASGNPNSGTQIMAVTTSVGTLNVKMNLADSPCTAASFRNLAEKNLFTDTKCHRAFPGMLQCGDLSAKGKGWRKTDGQGGPSYRFPDENLPTNDKPAYPRGVVAMANSGPGTNGSQFFFISKDTELNGPNYAVVGTVDEAGLKILDEVDKAGNDGSGGDGTGHPKKEVTIKSVTMEPAQS